MNVHILSTISTMPPGILPATKAGHLFLSNIFARSIPSITATLPSWSWSEVGKRALVEPRRPGSDSAPCIGKFAACSRVRCVLPQACEMDDQVPSGAKDASESGELPMFVICWTQLFICPTLSQISVVNIFFEKCKSSLYIAITANDTWYDISVTTLITNPTNDDDTTTTTSRFSGAPYRLEAQHGRPQ